MAVRVNNANFEEEVLKAEVPVLVEFYSDSCVPCKQMAAVLGDLEDEYESELKIVKVNVNYEEELTSRFEVLASPTIILFKAAKEIIRFRGITKKEILQVSINNNL